MEPNESRFMLERKSRLQLQRLIADGNTPQKIVKHARIVLMTADGHGVMAISPVQLVAASSYICQPAGTWSNRPRKD